VAHNHRNPPCNVPANVPEIIHAIIVKFCRIVKEKVGLGKKLGAKNDAEQKQQA
jgi:hypothetical protein